MSNATLSQSLHAGWWRASAAATDSLTVAAGLIRASAKRIEARWESCARDAVSLNQLRSMSERELGDIGISRSDIPRLLREANAADTAK